MFGFGTGGWSVGFGGFDDNFQFGSGTNPGLSPARPIAPTPGEWLTKSLVCVAGGIVGQKLNKSNEKVQTTTITLTRPVSTIAIVHGASATYQFTKEQLTSTRPIYRWCCQSDPQYPLYSFETDKKKGGFASDWYLESKIPVALVYTKQVKDSVGVIVFHEGPNPRYCYVRQDDASMIKKLQALKWKCSHTPTFYIPTKGPFSVIPSGPQPKISRPLFNKKKQLSPYATKPLTPPLPIFAFV